MRIKYILYCVLIMLICYTSCTTNAIEIDRKGSWLSNYEINENKVVVYCVVRVVNHSSEEKAFYIHGDFRTDQENGLLVERFLTACELGNDNTVFRISGNSSIILKIRFVGTYAGNPVMVNRILPSISLDYSD